MGRWFIAAGVEGNYLATFSVAEDGSLAITWALVTRCRRADCEDMMNRCRPALDSFLRALTPKLLVADVETVEEDS